MPNSSPVSDARRKASEVQRDLRVAGADLELAQEALDQSLPPEVKQGDVAWALDQNADVERRIGEAVEQLEEVSDLLQEAQDAGQGGS
jgi:type II secretory pathway pseudopilin PulG